MDRMARCSFPFGDESRFTSLKTLHLCKLADLDGRTSEELDVVESAWEEDGIWREVVFASGMVSLISNCFEFLKSN